MNFYNPYYMTMPVSTGRGLMGLFGRGGFNLGNLLNGAQRTLGLVNQAIPLIKQAAPMVRNAKTMFQVMNEFKRAETPQENVSNRIVESSPDNNVQNDYVQTNSVNSSGPTFFI